MAVAGGLDHGPSDPFDVAHGDAKSVITTTLVVHARMPLYASVERHFYVFPCLRQQF